MDKNAIKKYAVWAREELIKRVSTKAEEYGISKDNMIDENADSIGDKILTATEKSQRKNLIEKIKEKGYEQVVEEVAYTWFNRFIALRFMEVNGYLPTRVRVFADGENNFKPQILEEAIHLELDGLKKDVVFELKEKNENEALYKYLLITQCNALSSILPKMFPKIGDFTILLFPDNVLREGSVIEQLIAIIPEQDFDINSVDENGDTNGQVEILGWLYQYYNSAPKDIVFANLKKNIKISKENIPAATQLFTPDWIVRYMVENSLGRLYINQRKNEGVFADGRGLDEMTWHEIESKRISNEKYIAEELNWKYYLPEAEQKKETQSRISALNNDTYNLQLEELKIIDPCMGSGHILVYAFDVLMQIYENRGYSSRDAVTSILENNLFGLDIDERAYQLSYFALMMKAQSYDKRFLKRADKPSPQVYCPKGYADGEEYGSLLNVDELEEMPQGLGTNEQASLFDENYDTKLNTWNFRRLLNQKYDVVVTNPPYMGASGMSANLSDFVKKNYSDSKSDASTAFMEKSLKMCKSTGYMAMINIPVWMFLSSYEKLRSNILTQNTFDTMIHFGRGVFGSDFGTVAFVIAKKHIKNYTGTFRRLFEKQGAVDSVEQKEKWFFEGMGHHTATQENFSKIPGSPIAYWVSEKMLSAFEKGKKLGELADSKQGIATADNNRFLRLWSEVNSDKFNKNADSSEIAKNSNAKWFPYNKGGEFRKWYGNNDFVVNWENDGFELRAFKNSVLRNPTYYFRESFSWSLISSSVAAFRYKPKGQLFDVAGMSCFTNVNFYYLLALCNTNIVMEVLKIIAPTINYQCGDIANIPVITDETKKEQVETLVQQNISLSKTDWDSFETSWDFERHPLINMGVQNLRDTETGEKEERIEWNFDYWNNICTDRFNQLKANEEELNRIFIDIYGLQDELTPEVEDKDVTVRLADKTRDIKSFISYAVGCMFGRYSLDVDGLAYAGGDFDNSKYISFIPDADNIIPICDDEYFEDDIVGRFIKFVEVVYGTATLEENLEFIASALGTKGTAREVIRNYFLNGFYADHCKIYQKRPIYWLFDSGKKNGFKALVYMHRYAPDTIARMRTDYVHEQQGRYRTALSDLERRIESATTSERVKLTKGLALLKDQAEEIRVYEEKIHHLADQMISIDLDDGVKNNYTIFGDVLAKIK